MKLEESNITVEPILDEKEFSIENTAMLFDILRNKMYSDNIAAICREVSCNSRDAHREVGKFDVPIEITLPTDNDLYIKFKDFGPGISPDRMSNVFIKYTASTKRSNNIQTGGFGLGAKTPFSYSDKFTIVTIVDGIKYNYLAFIDETKVGKMILLSQIETSEENGTEIIIPVDRYDIHKFKNCIDNICKFWTVKPNLINYHLQPFDYKDFNIVLFSKNQQSIYSASVYALIDEIKYPIQNSDEDLQQKLSSLRSMSNGYDTYLKFNTGDLALVANREQLDYTEDTIKALKKKIIETILFIRHTVQEEVEKAESIFDALDVFEKYKIFKDLSGTYKGIRLSCSSLSFCEYKINNVKLYRSYLQLSPKKKELQKNSHSSSLSIEKDSLIVLNDVEDFSIDSFRDFFLQNQDVSSIQLVKLKDIKAEDQEQAIKDLIGLDEIEIVNASDIVNIAEIKEYSTKMSVFERTDKLARIAIKNIPIVGKKVIGVLVGSKYVFGDLKIEDYSIGTYQKVLIDTRFFIVKSLQDKARLERQFKFSNITDLLEDLKQEIPEELYFLAYLDRKGYSYDKLKFIDMPTDNILDPEFCALSLYLKEVISIKTEHSDTYYNLIKLCLFDEEKYNSLEDKFRVKVISQDLIKCRVRDLARKYPLLEGEFNRYSTTYGDDDHKVAYINWVHSKGNS